nr:hypothetical protein [Tanacetum cinerariifolium]
MNASTTFGVPPLCYCSQTDTVVTDLPLKCNFCDFEWFSLQIREEARKYIVEKLRNRRTTSMWYDNWSNIGTLDQLISNRDMYDERFSARMIVYEMTGHSNWSWPVVWTNKFPMLLSIQNINLNEQAEDKIMWKKKVGKVNNFSVKQNYTDLLVDEVDVECFNRNSINSNIRRLSFAASVYLLRQKRNRRIFKDERRSNEELFRIFNETVRLRLMILNVNDSSAFRKEQEAWDVKFCIKKIAIRMHWCRPMRKEEIASCDGGKGTWGGRVRVFGTVLVYVRVQEKAGDEWQLSHRMHPQSEAAPLSSRQLYQKPGKPPCLCCQSNAPPPPHCYCACFVINSENKSP